MIMMTKTETYFKWSPFDNAHLSQPLSYTIAYVTNLRKAAISQLTRIDIAAKGE